MWLVGAAEAEHQLSVILHTSPRWLIPVVGVHALQSGQFPDVVQAERPTRSGPRILSKESPPAELRNKPLYRTSTRARRASTGLPAAHGPCPAHRQRSRRFRNLSRIADEIDGEFSNTNQNAHCGAWLLLKSQTPVGNRRPSPIAEPHSHEALCRTRPRSRNGPAGRNSRNSAANSRPEIDFGAFRVSRGDDRSPH